MGIKSKQGRLKYKRCKEMVLGARLSFFAQVFFEGPKWAGLCSQGVTTTSASLPGDFFSMKVSDADA
jgi:hypothetical protein